MRKGPYDIYILEGDRAKYNTAYLKGFVKGYWDDTMIFHASNLSEACEIEYKHRGSGEEVKILNIDMFINATEHGFDHLRMIESIS